MKGINYYFDAIAVLFKVFFPLKLMRWLLVLSIFVYIFGTVLKLLLGWDWVNAIVMIGVLSNVLVSFVIIPSQVIALATSRSVTLLGDSRKTLLVTLLLMCFLCSVALYWSMNLIGRESFAISFFIILLMASVLLQLSVWVCSRWPGMQGFIFIANVFFADIASWLGGFHPAVVLMVLAASWIGFAYWWMRWQPAKYQANNAMFSGVELQKRRIENGIGLHVVSVRAHSWLGSRLFGTSDGWRARLLRVISKLAFSTIFFIPFILLSDREKFISAIQYTAAIFLLVMVIAVSQDVATNFFRNLRSIWLCSAGDRASLFSVAWRAYWRELLPWMLLFASLALVFELVFGIWRIDGIWLLFLVSVLLMQTVIFYLVWFVYQRTAASYIWCNWVCGVVCILWMYSICATGFLFQLPFEWQGISPLWLWVPEVIAITVLHKKVRNGFIKMDLLRVI